MVLIYDPTYFGWIVVLISVTTKTLRGSPHEVELLGRGGRKPTTSFPFRGLRREEFTLSHRPKSRGQVFQKVPNLRDLFQGASKL